MSLIFVSLGLVTHSGCVSTEAAYTLGGATLGGLSGALVSAQKPQTIPFASAGGAAVGGLMGSMLARSVKSGRHSAFTEGYQRGASDTIKRQYWILQNLQKDASQRNESRWTSYRIPIAPPGSANQVSNEVTIPILE